MHIVVAVCCGLTQVGVKAESVFDPSVEQKNQQRWDICTATFGPPALTGFSETSPDELTTHISAESASGEKQERFSMQGDVRLQRGDIRLRADQAEFINSTQTVTASGAVNYEFGGLRLQSEAASFNVQNHAGEISQSQYWLAQRHLRGAAESIRIENAEVLQLKGASITSCPDGQTDWVLRASEIRLDQGENVGVAKHARLEFMHVPLFYFPYLSFPISGRKTGLLVPDLGSSNGNGTEIGVPFYWNIAPDRDATITPYYYSDRGTQLRTEFRYLNPESAGQVNLEYLSNDDKFKDDRALGRLQHQSRTRTGWHSALDARYVSDSAYLGDFGGDLASASLTHLERRLDVGFERDHWHFNTLFQGFQTLDANVAGVDRPYQRLPQITLYNDPITINSNISTNLSTELVAFDRSEGVIGRRVNIQPAISWIYRQPAGFIVPQLVVQHTSYNLEHNADNTQDAPSRTLPLLSIDSGLFFERAFGLGQQMVTQTLEPRVYYLYAPFRDQSRLIVDDTGLERTFDSGLPSLSFDQLFQNNRFTGNDRVGDANQITLALTSRLLSEQGREMFSASVGEIIYFDDRRVTLPGQSVIASNRSDLVTEIRSRWTQQIEASASLLWDNEQNHNSRGAFKFRYQKDKDRILDLAYRYERNAIEQAEFGVLWPLQRQWKMVGRYYYSLFDQATLERLLGFEYESCCWTLRLVTRTFVDDVISQNQKNSVWLQLELKGLTSVGKKVTELFEHGRLE